MGRRLTVLVAASALAWPVAQLAAATAPTLRVRARDPFSLRGTHFQAFERVKLTLNGTWRKRVESDVHGTFVARFRNITVDICDGFVLRATGSKGSKAILRVPARECPSRNPG
jgi:hypothetical protein